jgi:bacteriorhodopsin
MEEPAFNLMTLATQYMFYATFAGMLASAVYMLMERNNLTPRYSAVASLCTMVVVIACVNYSFMKNMVGIDGVYESLARFPTQFRYADWVLTTPLILASLVLLTNYPRRGALMTKLMLADLMMIVLGYVGEVSINQAGGGTTTGWVCFLASCACFAFILLTIYTELSHAAADLPMNLRGQFAFLQNFVLIVWMVYPLGYMAPLLGYRGELLALRELIYCIADLTAKGGFGIVAISLAKRLSLLEMQSLQATRA